MASAAKINAGSKATQHPYGIAGSNIAMQLEKLNATARKSTPDSEALASSDDEVDAQRAFALPDVYPVAQQKPMRRASWLNDATPSGNQLRKGSFPNVMPPATNTPMQDSNGLSSHLQSSARAHTGAAPLWSQGIWSADASRKDASSRLAEVLPSPTSMYPPGSNNIGFYDANQQTPRSRDPSINPNIPFAIPLQPTLKTIRSQSYSVGQQEYDAGLVSPGMPASAMASTFAGRRERQHSAALQHRPSRPSMLHEVSNENIGLGNVREVEDDDDGSTTDGSTQGGVGLQSLEHQKIANLVRENAMLRQSFQNIKPRPRAPSVSAANYTVTGGHGIHESLLEESDYAVDENDELAELQDLGQRGIPGRRMSEYSAMQGMPQHMFIENRKLENLKKGVWSSSLGFPGSDVSQSRRHSFADTLPTRQGSVSSIGESMPTRETSADESTIDFPPRYRESIGQMSVDTAGKFKSHRRSATTTHVTTTRPALEYELFIRQQEASMKAEHSQYRQAANSYFSSGSTIPYRAGEPFTPNRLPPSTSLSQPAVYQPSQMYQQFGNSMHTMSQPRRDQPLFIVLFKCSRAEVFYVQEGTGLNPTPGELCIVEADRGTDLGTVAHENVSWADAKKYKDHYAEEHYKWLMMYSASAGNNQIPDGSCAGLMAQGTGGTPSAIGGMGPQNNVQESPSSEIKPKIIKRVAQPHEIQSLRDKEGNEAKAKRMCMQKVKEHGLKMEILDAEFQMDLKKLTFYYFADAYVNFNLLVTDLFKVYKTRIWMSAINPASFASPSAGLQAPSGVGPGAVGVRNMLPDRRNQQEDQNQQYGNRGFDSGYAQQSYTPGTERSMMSPQSYQQPPGDYSYGFSPFAAAPRNMNGSMASFNPSMMQQQQQMDPFTDSRYAPPTANYQSNTGRYPSPQGGAMVQGGDYARQNNGNGGQGEWMNSFQGLSLNTR